MAHVFFLPKRNAVLRKTTLLAFHWMAASLVFLITAVNAAEGDKLNQVVSLVGNENNTTLQLKIATSTEPTFTVYELFNPSRIIVDMADTELPESIKPEIPASFSMKIKTESLVDISPKLLRFELTMPQSSSFETKQQGNDVVLVINKEKSDNTDAKVAVVDSLTIDDINVETRLNTTLVTLKANGDITDYSYDILKREAGAPARLYIDINNASGDSLLQEQLVGTALSKIRVAKRGSGLRFVFDSSLQDMFQFDITPISEGLQVSISEEQSDDQVSNLISQKTNIDKQLPEVDPLAKKLSPQATEKQMQDAFNFSGYNKERITIDFYKIDLHNVFRLFREVSGVNIVVDQGVSGSLTLALDDVPWDFALDIVLNLKNLEKEERFNTLVILPKNKKFKWAEKAENNLTFEADIAVAEQEALIIKQQQNLPEEIIKAKEFMRQAKKAEQADNYESAVNAYEQAFDLWPDNHKIANRIASIYLVRLRQNAKAAFFAKKALTVEPANATAALNAAIALANMKEKKQAIEFFDMSINVEKPSSAALLSYAVFSEEYQEYDSALKLLNKHDAVYGKNLDSMVSVARVYDKMGEHAVSTEKYEAILLSGFRTPPDLAKFIKSRITLKQTM